MADKSQNILINYVFNTADVAKAEQNLNRANAASNQLQSNAQKAGKTISQSFSTATRSIFAMEQELGVLKTRIQLATDPRKIQQMSAEYKKLEAAIKAANVQAGLTKPAIDKTASAFKGLTTAVGGLLTLGLAREAYNIALNMASLAGNVEGVERAFNNRFPNAINLLEKLRAATHGTVTDFELMQRSLQATNLGVSVEKLPTLLEFAAARAQQTGQSVDYLVESIVNGIGRKSPLILDNLGISAVRLKEKFDGATLASQSVGDVTEAVGEIIEEEMKKNGGYVDTAKTKVEQMNVAVEHLQVTLAKKIQSGFLPDLVSWTAKGLENLLKLATGGFNELDRELLTNQASRTAAAVKESKAYKELGDDRQKQSDFIQQEINTRVEQIGRVNDNITALTAERNIIKDKNPYDERVDQLAAQIRGYNGSKFAIMETIKFLKQYRDEINKQNEEGKEVEPSGIISRKKDEIEALRKEIELTNKASDLTQINIDKDGNAVMQAGKLVVKLEILQAELADLQRAFTDIDIKPLDMKLGMSSKELDKYAGELDNLEESIARMGTLTVRPVQIEKPDDTVAEIDSFFKLLGDEIKDNWREIAAESVDILANMFSGFVEADTAQLQERLKGTTDFYKKQERAAGDNANALVQIKRSETAATNKIRNEIAAKEKKARRTQAIIDGAAGVVRAFATAPNIYIAIIQAALVAAATTAQIATINKQPDRFAKGVIGLKGKGTETSDSIPAMLSRNESVMTARETATSRQLLEDIRARKLDDRIYKQIKQGREPVRREVVQQSNFNDDRIVKELQQNRPRDYVKEHGVLTEVTKVSETLHRKVRSKSVHL